MAERGPSEQTTPSQLLLREAEDHYAGALHEMLALRKDLQAQTDVSEAEVRRVTANYTRATQTLFDERKKVEDFSRRNGGQGGERAIDFDAIRHEIGGLLDRLRAHRGPS